MKVAKVGVIICFGALVTLATVVALWFGDAFSGWGDGTANSVRRTSAWSAWPTAIFFILSACGPAMMRKARIILFLFSLAVLFGGFLVTIHGDDGIFLPVCVFIASLVIWLPLLLAAPRKEANQSPEPTAPSGRGSS